VLLREIAVSRGRNSRASKKRNNYFVSADGLRSCGIGETNPLHLGSAALANLKPAQIAHTISLATNNEAWAYAD